MMRTAISLVLILGAVTAWAATTTKVVDTEGQATVRFASGKTEKVAIGRTYATGDSLRTGKDGMVEMSQAGLTIRVGPSTVFTLLEREVEGKPKGVLAVTLGSVKMKYDRLTGSEPMIQSASAVAGVRGTELTVWAGSDGASQIIVDSGLVTVEAFGKTVELGPAEAVVVLNGQPPGDKFVVQRGLIDHAKWDQGRIDALLADPVAGTQALRSRLAYYVENARTFRDEYGTYQAKLDSERVQVKVVREEQGQEAAAAYEREHVNPLLQPTRNLFLNARYYLLAGFAMRRFVGGRMYVLLKSHYLADPLNATWADFQERFKWFLDDYEAGIVPYLVDADY